MSNACNTVHRPKLIRRLRTLEKTLRVPELERCRYEGELRKAKVISFRAVRVWDTQTGLDLDATGRPKRKGKGKGKESPANVGSTPFHADKYPNHFKQNSAPSDNWKWKGKSIWKGRDDEHVNVETRALQYYEDLGYKGSVMHRPLSFHCLICF